MFKLYESITPWLNNVYSVIIRLGFILVRDLLMRTMREMITEASTEQHHGSASFNLIQLLKFLQLVYVSGIWS